MPICTVGNPVRCNHPKTGHPVILKPGVEYDDAVAEAYPWAFPDPPPAKPKRAARKVRVEQATAAPGEER